MVIPGVLCYNEGEKQDSGRPREVKSMLISKDTMKNKLQAWADTLQAYALPAWNDFPALPLYMDQVIYLMNQYLSMTGAEKSDERTVTPAMINNYVKLKIIPAPVKKRYGRVHLAYLVMVCLLKQSMNTSDIRKLLPLSMSEKAVQDAYAAFIQVFSEVKLYFSRDVCESSLRRMDQEDTPATHLMFRAATAANLSRLMTEQLISLLPEAKSSGAS